MFFKNYGIKGISLLRGDWGGGHKKRKEESGVYVSF